MFKAAYFPISQISSNDLRVTCQDVKWHLGLQSIELLSQIKWNFPVNVTKNLSALETKFEEKQIAYDVLKECIYNEIKNRLQMHLKLVVLVSDQRFLANIVSV